MQDPFSVFGVPRRLALDLAEGERRWHDRARALHPDHVVCATPVAIADATATAAAVNTAWKLLRDPLLRARAWLALEMGSTEPDRGSTPPLLAMRGFRIQEAVEAAGDGDVYARMELEALASEVSADMAQARDDFVRLAASEPSMGDPARQAFRASVGEWVSRVAYLTRQQIQIDEARGDA